MIYQPAKPPYAHQIEALRRMEGREAFALLMEMRTGKTKVLLDDWGRMELAGAVQTLLVLAPGGVYRTWEAAVQEHLSEDLRQRVLVHVWQSGAGKKARARLDAFLRAKDRPRILLMNIEALSAIVAARNVCIQLLKDGRAMLAIDESTIIKNPTAKRTKFVVSQLSPLADYRRILSGLPTPRSPLDIYAQFYFLDWRILSFKSYFSFRARYAVMQRVRFGGREVPLIKGYQNTEELAERIAPHSYRVRLSECYDLPPKVYMLREVPLTDEQKRLYNEMRDYATAHIAGEAHVTATIVISQILRLHQILCGHTVDELGLPHQVPERRTGELVNLLSDYSGKAVVWCSYDANVQRVAEALEQEFGAGCTARFWGGNMSGREDEERRFLTDPECRFMVATPAAGGRGRTWTVADLLVYYSNTNNLEHRSQSEERGTAIGKASPITVVDLVSPGTVDERIIQALRQKIDMASAITGDTYKEWLI